MQRLPDRTLPRRILAISSQVVRGHVGLSAIVPALQALGHEVWPLPTILLSNHPAHPHVAGARVAVAQLDAMLDALEANGWLRGTDSVLTGYLPSAEHVAFAVRAIERVREHRSHARVVVDPVLGDEPNGLYIEEAAAQAIRDRLVPLADVLTPNRFELGWLTGMDVSGLESARHGARVLVPAAVIVTSAARVGTPGIPLPPPPPHKGEGSPTESEVQAVWSLVTLLVAEGMIATAAVPWRAEVPRGTGDLFAGLLTGHLLHDPDAREALARAVAGVEVVVAASAGRDELALTASLRALPDVAPWPTEPVA